MMSRTTSEGVAPVALLVELFDLSRAAYYQALRGDNAHTGHREQPYRSIVITRFGAS